MRNGTAPLYAEVRYCDSPSGYYLIVPDARAPQAVAAERLPSDSRLSPVLGPTQIAAKWMSALARRILDSVPARPIPAPHDEGFLDPEIASKAVIFFRETSDLLPMSEPYIYTSLDGDLVAEFVEQQGKLTNVISKNTVSSFVVSEVGMFKATENLPFEDINRARKELQKVTAQLRTGARPNGNVEA
jgi:hypothetical protein